MRSVTSSTSRRMIQRAASGTDEMIAPPVSRIMQRSASVSRAAFASAHSSRLLQRIPSNPMGGGGASSSCSSSQSPLLPVTVPLSSSPSLRRHSSFQHNRSNPTRATKPFGLLQTTFAVLAVACCTITFWSTTHKAHGTVHRKMEAFTVSTPLTSTKPEAVDRLPHVPEKEPILQLLRDAGILELDPETLESLPTWSDVVYVYCACVRARCERFCCTLGSPVLGCFRDAVRCTVKSPSCTVWIHAKPFKRVRTPPSISCPWQARSIRVPICWPSCSFTIVTCPLACTNTARFTREYGGKFVSSLRGRLESCIKTIAYFPTSL
jgi:hypothetical protein